MAKSFVTTGKIHFDSRGAARIYIKKRISDAIPFEHGEEVRVEVYPEENKIVITKL